jgi:hypothetical protein
VINFETYNNDAIICVVDCKSLHDDPSFERRRRQGVHSIYVEGVGRRSVFCDMDGGGWTKIQSRTIGNVNFTRGIDDYINGFGDVDGDDYWMGLEMIHRLTNIPGTTCTVKITSTDSSTGKYINQVEYNVSVGNHASGYKLQVGIADNRPSVSYPYKVRPIKGLRSGDGMRFSTVDHDLGSNCSAGIGGGGGWWYGRGPEGCSYILINAVWDRQGYGGTSVDGGSSYIKTTFMYMMTTIEAMVTAEGMTTQGNISKRAHIYVVIILIGNGTIHGTHGTNYVLYMINLFYYIKCVVQ